MATNNTLIRLWVSRAIPGLYFAETHKYNGLHYGRPVNINEGGVLRETAIESMYSMCPEIDFVRAVFMPPQVLEALDTVGITVNHNQYRLAVRLMIAGVLLTGMGVWALLTLTGGALEEVRYLGFVLLIAGLAAMVVGVVLWGWLLLRPKPTPLGRATRVNFDRVQEGMTPDEVAAILGPKIQHTKTRSDPFNTPLRQFQTPTDVQWWLTDDTFIRVYYCGSGADKRVVFKDYNELPPESLRDRLRRWLPWCERAFGSS